MEAIDPLNITLHPVGFVSSSMIITGTYDWDINGMPAILPRKISNTIKEKILVFQEKVLSPPKISFPTPIGLLSA